jgi:nitric oxide reductase NorD protein
MSKKDDLASKLKEGIIKNLKIDFFEEEEINEILKEIDSFDQRIRQKILSLTLNLSAASSSLVGNTLKKIKKASMTLSIKELEKWLSSAFELLDLRGIDPFISFISDISEDSLKRFKGEKGVFLKDIRHLLEIYIRGISNKDIKISSNHVPYTDTLTIFLPPVIDRFDKEEDNFLLYKLISTYLLMQIMRETLKPDKEIINPYIKGHKIKYPDISHLFGLFKNRKLAIDIFNILEALRHKRFLSKELPGLIKNAEKIESILFDQRPDLSQVTEKTSFLEGLYQYFLKGETKGILPIYNSSEIPIPRCISETIEMLFNLYEETTKLKGDYEPIEFFFGDIDPEKVSHRLNAQRLSYKKRLEGIITRLINMPEFEPKERHPVKALRCEAADPNKEYLLIKGKIIELDEESRNLIEEKEIFGGVLVKGSEIGGGCTLSLKDLLLEEQEIAAEGGGIRYVEWDYRRGDYKKKWCSLYEKDLHPAQDTFVEETLRRYSGYVDILRRKFELLKKEPKTLKRQRDGDDIDIDAIVEAFSDIYAGKYPSENLFTRLDRYERNIAVLFLLDMSGSTKGWINEAQKEALVLMCEALESLGDRYAIYGFSGMTRLRCDFYKIKEFNEPYSEMVKKRIAGITPKDYTRMGPAIRHAISILRSVDARTRLLIVISDGKPEDWDAYKGDYAIEDTRKALIEAKEVGIHPFCITIDREAQSYLPHMFGEVNYIFIDDVKKLPNKITEIYRRLTS